MALGWIGFATALGAIAPLSS
jgi:hypothetical protein